MPTNIKGDLMGSIAAAITTIPLSIGYGIIAFAPLGADFIPIASLIGIYAAIFAGFLAPLFGGTQIQITCPNAPLTLILASFIAIMAAKIEIPDVPTRYMLIVGLASLCVLTAGMVQIIFGALRLGNLVKYVPYPIESGFMNGIAFILISTQIRPFLGINGKTSFFALLHDPSLIQPLTVLVGVTTLIALFLSSRFIKSIPAPFIGLAAGTTVYYFLRSASGISTLGPVIGAINFRWTKPDIPLEFIRMVRDANLPAFIPHVLATGFALGFIGSMESLFSAMVSDNMTGTRHNSNKELIGQGIGNIANSLFGALPAGGTLSRSMTNFRAGGRTRVSGMTSGLIILLLVLTLGNAIGGIPLVVFSGLFISVGFGLFDRWTLNLLRELSRPSKQRKNILLNLFISLSVTVITVSLNLVFAVGIGMAIASVLFVAKMGKSIIRRKYFGDQIRSKKVRSLECNNLLDKKGGEIVIFELQGPLFFGSSENLAKKIESDMERSTYCILDMKRVNEIDSTGANIIGKISTKLVEEGKHVLISYLKSNPSLSDFIEVMGIYKILPDDCFFPDTDQALEWAENDLLGHDRHLSGYLTGVPLEDTDIFHDFTEGEMGPVREKLARKTYRKGDLVIKEGDADRNLFILTRGSVSIKMILRESNRYTRLVTYSAGVIFGEMAFLDGSPRSADVWSETDSEAFTLSPDEFENLRRENPEIAVKLIRNIALEVSRRLRTTSNEVRVLEEG
jgi:SulP family sulfate permease